MAIISFRCSIFVESSVEQKNTLPKPSNLMKIKFLLLAMLSAFLFALPTAKSQVTSDTTLLRIETNDGNSYIGTIVSQDADAVQFKTELLGIINIQKAVITTMEPIKQSEMRGQTYWYENAYATTRYFFNTNGYSRQKGEGYYQNTWVAINGVNVGLTNNLSIGVGMVPTFLFALGESVETPVWLTPKLTIPIKKDKVNLGIGALHAFLVGGGDNNNGSAGILYGTATFGPKNHNISMGLGWGYASGNGMSDRPTISISYLKRKSPKWAFVTENYYIAVDDDAVVILSAGARYIGRKLSIDFGGFTTIMTDNQDVIPILPWLSLAVPFKIKSK
jgi:hypothetical protein